DAIEAAADAHAYNVLTWEVRHLPGKWLYKIGHLLEGRTAAADDEALSRYFQLGQEIDRLERDPSAAERLQAARRQRDGLKNEVEDILEGRVTQVLKEQGLVIEPPLFSDLGLVFPPVDFEPDLPPRVLAISPRDRIELDRSYLLAPGLDRSTVTAIEAEAEAGGGVSALVIPSGGVATYPSIVSELAPYDILIEDVFHEWLHQYLALFPLGRSYFAGSQTRTLNETVADLAGRELARLFLRRYGSPLPAASPASTPSGGFDFTAEMRALRQRVEQLLAAGQITEAEALMAQKRDEFEARGVYIRRLNQAYFAFHGAYADAPGSIDPIGPKLQTLLERAGSPGQFVRLAAQITSEKELDRLLAGG
ncbi:MAG: hypothetical protein HYY03_05165, partial [Chloroflexi bacterium]|nr:hypothetical protein [Chloroflexota bacterium]